MLSASCATAFHNGRRRTIPQWMESNLIPVSLTTIASSATTVASTFPTTVSITPPLFEPPRSSLNGGTIWASHTLRPAAAIALLDNFKFDVLPISETPESISVNAAVMHEDVIGTVVGNDETKSLFDVKPLDRASGLAPGGGATSLVGEEAYGGKADRGAD
mmetsp:Transcript_14185/g.41620  ORF Transcript_14185/g.41620 Transcript_14185/m.41620 type:complete len:161 (+) Transcript_14185:382-864(+)